MLILKLQEDGIVDKSIDKIVSILGILKARGSYVPINPAYPDNMIQHIIGGTGLCVMVIIKDYYGIRF